jgi:hypothetical protein
MKAPAPKVVASTRKPGSPVTQGVTGAAPVPTVEMIRGDKRSAEVIK